LQALLLLTLSATVFAWLKLRADAVVTIRSGEATLRRGHLPVLVMHDLDALARSSPHAEGRVRVRGRGREITLSCPGLDEATAQRVRNTVLIHRARI